MSLSIWLSDWCIDWLIPSFIDWLMLNAILSSIVYNRQGVYTFHTLFYCMSFILHRLKFIMYYIQSYTIESHYLELTSTVFVDNMKKISGQHIVFFYISLSQWTLILLYWFLQSDVQFVFHIGDFANVNYNRILLISGLTPTYYISKA